MGWQSSDAVRFDLGHLVEGQTKVAKLILGPRVLGYETDL